MTTAATPLSPNTGAAPFRLILRSEVRRISSRRSVRLLLAAGVAGVLSYSFFALMSHASLNAHALAIDNAKLRAYEAQIRAVCLKSQPPGMPAGGCNVQMPLTAVPGVKLPFSASAGLMTGASVIGGMGILLALLVGASYMGGEYQSRVISLEVALEPRRLRVFFAKLLVLVLFLLIMGIVLELLWLGLGSLTAYMVGNFNGFGMPQVVTLLSVQAQIIVLLALVGIIGFSLTAMVKNTAGSLGIMFVYLLIGERIMASVFISLSAHLLSYSFQAIESVKGIEVLTSRFAPPAITGYNGSNFSSGSLSFAKNMTHLSPMEGLFTVVIYAMSLAIVSGWIFCKRDIL